MKLEVKLIIPVILLLSAGVFAADWPQYLGPDRDSTSTEKGILKTWPDEGPKVLWTIPLGVGFGGPAVVDGTIYLLDRDEKVGDTLRALELSSGRELWNFAYNAPGSFMFPGSRSTPAVDGDYLYTVGPMGDLYCISISTHKPVWNKNIWTDFGGDQLPTWGITQNPLIYGDALIAASQAPEAGVVAYNKLTGELKWKSAALPGSVGYVSPSLVKVNGEDQFVMIMAATGRGRNASGGGAHGIDPHSGKVLWTYDNYQCAIPVPHAVDAGEGRILITGGYNAGAAMIQVQKKADGGYEVTELYKNVDFGSHTQPPILYEDHFYAHYTTNERNDGLVCMSMDGKVLWKTGQDPAFNKGGSVLVDNLLISVDGSTKLYLIDPDPSGFKPLGSVELLQPGENWAPIALVDGHLIIRDQKSLKCVAVGP